VTYVAAPPDGAVGIAFAIGKPVGTAVVRNRIRRRLRAALVELTPPPGDYLIAVVPAAAQASYQALRADLASCLAELAPSRAPAPG
jgi:ribonuclease P protein component